MPGGVNYRPGGADQPKYEADLRSKADAATVARLEQRLAQLESGMRQTARSGSGTGSTSTTTSTGSSAGTSGAVASGIAAPVSIALSFPTDIFGVGDPVTTTAGGILSATFKAQAANTFFRGPSSGAAAVPTFGALVNADLPASGVTAGTFSSVTVNSKGVVTAGTALGACYIPVGARYATSTSTSTVNVPASAVGRLHASADTGDLNLYLPEPAASTTPDGAVFYVFRDDKTANNLSIYCAGAGTMGGATTAPLYIAFSNYQDGFIFIADKTTNNYVVIKL